MREWGLGETEWQMENHPFGEAACGGWASIIHVGARSVTPPCMGLTLCVGTVLGLPRVLLAMRTRIELIQCYYPHFQGVGAEADRVKGLPSPSSAGLGFNFWVL